MTDLKVAVAAFIGTAAPASNLFLSDAEPLFRVLALVAQIVVAVITSVYILVKIRAIKKSKHDDETP